MHSSVDIAFTLLKHEDRYIFQYRDDKPGVVSPGLFAGFGGKIEEGEEPLEAARRTCRRDLIEYG